jgi:hypothetical protein
MALRLRTKLPSALVWLVAVLVYALALVLSLWFVDQLVDYIVRR